jgi:hypothetical protein
MSTGKSDEAFLNTGVPIKVSVFRFQCSDLSFLTPDTL